MTTPDRPGSIGSEFEELAREAEELRQAFAAGQDPSAEYSAQDDSGTVQITVDGRGRVSKVQVDRDWEDVVGVEGLGPAVLDAVNNAVMQRLAAWEIAVADPGNASGAGGGGTRGRPAGGGASRTRPPAAPPPDRTAQQRQVPGSATPTDPAQVLAWLENFDAELDRFERRLTSRLHEETVGRSPGHHVTVTLTGGQVSAIDIDQRWLDRGAHPHRLGEEIRGAFEAAYERGGDVSFESLLGDSPLGKLYALGNDPRRMWGRLAD